MSKFSHLTQKQRYAIQYYLEAGICKNEIARRLNVHRSTVYRELNRNSLQGVYHVKYDASKAQGFYEYHLKYKAKRVRITESMRAIIDEQLHQLLSPEQIKLRCNLEGIPMISHEAIYQYIYQEFKKKRHLEWLGLMRRKRRKRKNRLRLYKQRGIIKDRVSITQRPQIVDQRRRIGDWEADTIIGKNHQQAIVTITERKTMFTLMKKVKIKSAENVMNAIIELLHPFRDKVHTITVDNGKEFAYHKHIAERLKAKVYFAHPYSAFERGLNENINGLIRQYLPKKTDFREIHKNPIKRIQNNLNLRPRKTLNALCPYEIFFNQRVALIS